MALCPPGFVREWSSIFTVYSSGLRDDKAYSIKADSAGNVYAAGADKLSNITVDRIIAKYTPTGSPILRASYNGNEIPWFDGAGTDDWVDFPWQKLVIDENR